ncbi:MAG: Hsp33 family molecular chaperone HslO [Eubacteriales bacterium]
MNTSMITRALTSDGGIRLIFADTSAIVQQAHIIHKTSKTITAVLGRCLTAASILGSLLKDADNTVTLQINGDGPAGKIICISDYKGCVRGYIENPDVELPPNSKGKLDVGGAVGQGTLTIIRDLGNSESYTGVSNLVSGEIAEDITAYFASSEQTPSVCALGVRAAKDNSCTAAGGFLLQLMPGADDTVIDILESNINALEPVSTLIERGETSADIIKRIFIGIEYDLFDEINIEYKCPCSRETYIRALIGLGETELIDMIKEEKPIETICRYCRTHNMFSIDELKEMLKVAK